MKTLLFGPAGAGKTSLMRTTCQGYSYFRVIDLPPTKGISRETFLFRGLLELSIWDAGGQEKYLERYFSETQKGVVFAEVTIPIFMCDSTDPDPNHVKMLKLYLDHLVKYSPAIKKVYVLINKVDLPNAQPDALYQILTKDLTKEERALCEFTPVSVKQGSAQHRLIEILDYTLQESTLEMQKIVQIRKELDLLKNEVKGEFFLYNRDDGLLITSTLGKLESDPLLYISLSSGSLESNVDLIHSQIETILGKSHEPLGLKNIIYESNNYFMILHELSDDLILISVTAEHDFAQLQSLLTLLNQSNEKFKKIFKILK